MDGIVLELKAGSYDEAYCDIFENICLELEHSDPNDANIIQELICKQYNIPNKKFYAQQSASAIGTPVPKCPTCGSTNIVKHGVGARILDGFVFGHLSVEGRAQWMCKACGHMW